MEIVEYRFEDGVSKIVLKHRLPEGLSDTQKDEIGKVFTDLAERIKNIVGTTPAEPAKQPARKSHRRK